MTDYWNYSVTRLLFINGEVSLLISNQNFEDTGKKQMKEDKLNSQSGQSLIEMLMKLIFVELTSKIKMIMQSALRIKCAVALRAD